MNTFITCMARYMRAGPLEIRQLYHLHGQDSGPRRDDEKMVAEMGYDRACSGTIQPGFWTGLREYPVCHLCLKKRSNAKSNAIIVLVVVCGPLHARTLSRTNAAAGGQWGKKVRTTFEPAAPSILNAPSSRSPPQCPGKEGVCAVPR